MSNIYSGSGSPNSSVYGKPGDYYLDTAGGAGNTLWVKESGTATNTGWVAYSSGGGSAIPLYDAVTPVASPMIFSLNANVYNDVVLSPKGQNTFVAIKATGSNSVITGFTGGSVGQIITLFMVTSSPNNIRLGNQELSVAGNQILTNNGGDYFIQTTQVARGITLVYDGTYWVQLTGS